MPYSGKGVPDYSSSEGEDTDGEKSSKGSVDGDADDLMCVHRIKLYVCAYVCVWKPLCLESQICTFACVYVQFIVCFFVCMCVCKGWPEPCVCTVYDCMV
jgi:hypothetical protein